jgi:hypothetical protein
MTMPDLITHSTAATVATVKYSGYGALGSVVALLFDVHPSVVIASFLGAMFAVMLLHTFSFKIAAFVISLGTFSSSYAVPFIHQHVVGASEKGVGFFFAFITIYFWSIINESLRKVIKSRIEKAGN